MRAVTTPDQRPPDSRHRVRVELAALALIVLGVLCVVVAAAAYDWRAALAITGGALTAGGWQLATSED